MGEVVRNSGIPREEIFVITKLYPNQFSDPEAAIEEAYLAMEKAVEDGKIRSVLPIAVGLVPVQAIFMPFVPSL